MTNHYRRSDYRTARTMSEAFGPYAQLSPTPTRPMDRADRIAVYASLAAVLALGLILAIWR